MALHPDRVSAARPNMTMPAKSATNGRSREDVMDCTDLGVESDEHPCLGPDMSFSFLVRVYLVATGRMQRMPKLAMLTQDTRRRGM